jgi:hypothetical protein
MGAVRNTLNITDEKYEKRRQCVMPTVNGGQYKNKFYQISVGRYEQGSYSGGKERSG